MRDEACVRFLQWCLPPLRKRWPGFRKVRGQVCKRIDRRLRQLGLAGPDPYRAYLETHPEEWAVLDGLCRVTISRFYRDRDVFDVLGEEVLPTLAEAARRHGEPALLAGGGLYPFGWSALRPRGLPQRHHLAAAGPPLGDAGGHRRRGDVEGALQDLPPVVGMEV